MYGPNDDRRIWNRGDTVTLIGQDGDNYLSVNQISLLSNTITNETLSVIGERVKRVYHL